MKKYTMKYRPAAFSSLPPKLDWYLLERPSYLTARADLPQSKHPHGVFACRELTAEEMEQYEIDEVLDGSPAHSARKKERTR